MSDSDDDLPLATRAPAQTTYEHVDSDDDVPLGTRIPVASSTKANPKLKSAANKSTRKRKTRDVEHDSSSGDDDSDDEGNRPDHSYVLTAPPHVVRLNPTDTLYIIATTAWAWSNLPELIELRKVFWVIFLQRQFRLKCEQRREKERLQVQKAAEKPWP